MLPTALHGGPFTTAEAREAGVGRGALRGPSVRRVFPGVYVAADVEPTEATRVAAALKLLPVDTLATGVTALRLLGVAVGRPEPLVLVSTHPHQVRLTGVQVSRVRQLPPSRRLVVSPEHAFVAAASRLDLVELVAAGDWLVRLRRCTSASLVNRAASSTGRGVRIARRAAELVRERVDSPRETRLRLCLVLAGLPEPVCNLVLGTADHPIGRVDLVYEELKVILEYEGDQHRTDVRQWNRDIDRQEAFEDEGWRVIRVTSTHLRRPRDTIERVYRLLCAAGYSGPAPVFGSEWTALFAPTARWRT